MVVSRHATLGDAEQVQRRLSRAGLKAFIEKPSREASNQYQVFLGPFSDPAMLEAARGELAALDFTTESTP